MNRKKILLVDDSSTILMMEKFILRNGPYELVTATNGEEGVRKAAEQHARPHPSRRDHAEDGRLRSLPADPQHRRATSEIPIIMVTTRGEAANVEAGWANGCTDYVTKPINAIELLAKVRNFLGDEVAQ